MPTNDFIGFASAGSANVMSQADYAAAAEQGDGVQPGMASSKLANKIWRQGANMAAALGRITAARGYDALDNGDLDALQSSVDDAISVGTFNRMYFSQTSGNYIAPRTGVYRVTLKGGGGGGGGADTNIANLRGLGGGEGGTLVFYQTLTKSQSYAYTIGAGGSGGTIDNGGSNGGNTTFNGFTAPGGGGGSKAGNITKRPGAGGSSFTVPAGETAFKIPGAPGESAGGIGSGTSFIVSYSPNGGGNGGGVNGLSTPTFGGGGGGSSSASTSGQTGADGFILIEYAG